MASPRIPQPVTALLERLWSSGHAAYVVGGALRDQLLGREATDWDIATSARPEHTQALFPHGHRDNRFGTVTVDGVQITTFRRDHQYSDHRRPDSVTFTDRLDEDLARRDFTVNAIAFGRAANAAGVDWVDPVGGRSDLEARVLRAVGEPRQRFEEDALRLVRAARLAAQLGFSIEPRTREAMDQQAALVRHVSNERVGQELLKLLDADRPSDGLRLIAESGLLEPLLPELAAQLGVPQNKVAGEDLWDHTLRTVDAAAAATPRRSRVVLAALLHDIGKPVTFSDGHFLHHDRIGAEMAAVLLARLAVPRRTADPVAALVRHHMFEYRSAWSDAAVRRFILRVGVALVDDLLALRAADDVGSGRPAGSSELDELRRRVRSEIEARRPLTLAHLAVDGDDLQTELGIEPGPALGELLSRLLDAVLEDPARNEREELLRLARLAVRSEPVVPSG